MKTPAFEALGDRRPKLNKQGDYWLLSYSWGNDEPSIDLLIDHAHPEDTVSILLWDQGDAFELIHEGEIDGIDKEEIGSFEYMYFSKAHSIYGRDYTVAVCLLMNYWNALQHIVALETSM